MDAAHDPTTWLVSDYEAGLCTKDQIGGPRAVLAAPQAPVVVIDYDVASVSLRQRLRDDALRAYHDLGGVDYLKRKPELLDKILAKIALPDVEPKSDAEQEWPAWLTARRLAYQEANQVVADIASRPAAAPRPLANAPTAAPPEVLPEVAPEPVAPPTPAKPVKGVRDLLPKDLTQIVRLSDLKR